MGAHGTLTGIDLASLQDAFAGSEDVLAQMLALFGPQARERMAQLEGALAAWDVQAARQCLHSLVNICGAVHAYGMSDKASALGDAIKGDDRALAMLQMEALKLEAGLVLRQASALLGALTSDPDNVWDSVLPD